MIEENKQGLFPEVSPEQEARLEPVTEADVRLSPEEAAALAQNAERAFVIGGGSVYRQMLPYCDCAYVTKVHTTLPCDTDFPDLDKDPQWKLTEVLQSGEENGIRYEMCLYHRAM